MSFGVLGEYANSLFASFPCTHRFFPYSPKNAQILSTYSPNTLRYFLRTLHRRLNTFRISSKYAERMTNTQRDFFTSTMTGDFKGTVFQKNGMGGSILA